MKFVAVVSIQEPHRPCLLPSGLSFGVERDQF